MVPGRPAEPAACQPPRPRARRGCPAANPRRPLTVPVRLPVEDRRRLVLGRQDGDARDLHDRAGQDRRLGGAAATRPVRGPRQPADRLVPTPGSGPLRRRPGHRDRRVLLEDSQADLLDLVAERRGPLELELLAADRISASIRPTSTSTFLRSASSQVRPAARASRSEVYTIVDSATAWSRWLRSWMPLTIVVGSMPFARL